MISGHRFGLCVPCCDGRHATLRAARWSASPVNLIEGADGLPSTTRGQLEAVQATLEAEGIEFLGGDARGVRLRAKKRNPKSKWSGL